MADPKKRRRLRNVLILPGYQGRVALFIFIAGLICAGLNSYLYYAYVVDSYSFILRHSSLSKELIENRYDDLFNFSIALGLATLLIVLAIVIWALFMTHRAAGAIYHVQRVIGEIRSGDTKARIHLRARDEFQQLAQAFNQMMDELQERAGRPCPGAERLR